jgi:hypothetical protein
MMTSRFLFCVLLAALPLSAQAQSAPDKTMQMLQIVADQQAGGGTSVVTVGALGDDIPKVPLPDAEIVGTIVSKPTGDLGALVGENYELYYLASDAQIKNYGDALKGAGWKQQALTGNGGFVSNAAGDVSIYCHADSPTITTTTGGSPRHLQVSIVSGKAATTMCGLGNMIGMMKAFAPSADAPLPTLQAPAGSQMQASLSTATLGRTAARITSSSDAQTLLDAFGTQFTSAGWTSGAKTSGTGIASQTFSLTDSQKHEWECVLTIYALNGTPGTYLASIQPTDLTATK